MILGKVFGRGKSHLTLPSPLVSNAIAYSVTSAKVSSLLDPFLVGSSAAKSDILMVYICTNRPLDSAKLDKNGMLLGLTDR